MGIKTEALLLAQLEALEIKDRDAQAEITKLREEVSYLRHGIKNGHFKSDEQVEIKPLSVEGWRAHPEEMERIDAYIKNLIKEARAAAEPGSGSNESDPSIDEADGPYAVGAIKDESGSVVSEDRPD